MWSSTGRSDLALAAVFGALAACTGTDVVIHVTRSAGRAVDVQVCDPTITTSCSQAQELFQADVPASTSRTYGIVVDGASDGVLVWFTEFTPALCHYLQIPLDDLPLDVTVTLPDTAAALDPTGCPGCTTPTCVIH